MKEVKIIKIIKSINYNYKNNFFRLKFDIFNIIQNNNH